MSDLNDPKNEPGVVNQAYQSVSNAANAVYQQLPAAETVKSYVPGLGGSSQPPNQDGVGPSEDRTTEEKGGADITNTGTEGQSDPPHQAAAHTQGASSTSPDESTSGKRDVPGPKSPSEERKEQERYDGGGGGEGEGANDDVAAGGEGGDEEEEADDGEEEEGAGGEGGKKSKLKSKVSSIKSKVKAKLH